MISQKQKQVIALFAVLGGAAAILGLAYSYRQANTPATAVDFIMDTVVEQKLYGAKAKEATAEISARLQAFEQSFSMHLPESEITKLNQAAGKEAVKLSDDVYALLSRSKELSLLSGGAFDVTIAPLSNVWGVTSESPSVPEEAELLAAQELVNINDLILGENNSAMLAREGQAVDLGGIAKGSACQIIFDVAEEYGIFTGYVSIGGNMVVLEKKPLGRDLQFGVRDPAGDSSQAICALTLYGKTMATTGGYERYFEEDGVRYHHVLDPQTGWPADSDLLSVTVISEDGTLADYLSTTLFVLGKETVLNCLDRTDFQVIAVGDDHRVYCSTTLEGELIPMSDGNYTFIYGEEA